MPSLLEILNDPNYTQANQATKEAIFARYAPLDENYATANDATKEAIRQRFGIAAPTAQRAAPQQQQQEQPAQQPKKPSGIGELAHEVADVPLALGRGLVDGVRMLSSAFGADAATSNALRGASDYIASLMSAQSKQDSREMSRIMKEAEDKGVADQVVAGVKALSVAPIDTVVGALGTAAPAILAALGATLAAPATATMGTVAALSGAAATATGMAMGAGTIKDAIYTNTKEELAKYGVPPEQIEKIAVEAQNYNGKNLDQILVGSVLGGLGARYGIDQAIARGIARRITTKAAAEAGEAAAKSGAAEYVEQSARKAAEKGVLKRVGTGMFAEGAPEFLQGGQEQMAQNIALQREGYNVPTMRGVVGSGTLEGLAGAGLGAVTSIRKPRVAATAEDKALAELDELIRQQEEQEQNGTATKKPRAKKQAAAPVVSAPLPGVDTQQPATESTPPDDEAANQPSPVEGMPQYVFDAAVDLERNRLGRDLTPEEAVDAALRIKFEEDLYTELNRSPTSEEVQERIDEYYRSRGTTGSEAGTGSGVASVQSDSSGEPSAATEPAEGTAGVDAGRLAVSSGAVDTTAAGESTADRALAGKDLSTLSEKQLQDTVEDLFGLESEENKRLASEELARRKQDTTATATSASTEEGIDPELADLDTVNREIKRRVKELNAIEAEQNKLRVNGGRPQSGSPEAKLFDDLEVQAGYVKYNLAPYISRQQELTSAAQPKPAEKQEPTPQWTRDEALDFARASAQMALDQTGDYGSVEESIANHRENIRETLQEKLSSVFEADAFSAFDEAVKAQSPAAQQTAPATERTYPTAAELMQEIVALEEKSLRMLDKKGRRPRSNTKQGKEWDAIQEKLGLLKYKWDSTDRAERRAKQQAEGAAKQTPPQTEALPAEEATDDMYLPAMEAVQSMMNITPKALSQELGIGFNRASKLLELLERDNVVSEMDDEGKRTLKESGAAPDVAPRPAPTADDIIAAAENAGLPADVAAAINDNDTNRVLAILGQRLTGFYKDLANRLNELGLTVDVSFDTAAAMVRKAVDIAVGKSELRLFAYVQQNLPELYNKYFQNYDRDENLRRVYDGLRVLKSSHAGKLGPVIGELESVVEAYDKHMPSLDARGVFYPQFNRISFNLNAAGGVSPYVLLHEYVHAATEYMILQAEQNPDKLTPQQRQAYAELKELFEYSKTQLDTPLYGLTNLSEFVAEALSSRSFQRELRKVELPTKKESLLRSFAKAVLKLFGMNNAATNAMLAAEKLFSAEVTIPTTPLAPLFAPKGKRNRGPIKGNWRAHEDVSVTYTQMIKDMLKGRRPWSEVLTNILPAMWDTKSGVLRAFALPSLTLRQLSDLTKSKFPQIAGAIRTIDSMIAYRAAMITQASDIITTWVKEKAKSPMQDRLMSRVMLEATISSIEVDPLGPGYDATKVPPALKNAWNTLSPTFQQIYRGVRDFYAKRVTDMVKELKARANLIPDPVARAAAVKKVDDMFANVGANRPYFPLRRFGQFWFQVGEKQNKEFYEFESRRQRDLAFNLRRKQLAKGNARQKLLAETLRKGNGISDLYRYNTDTKVLEDVKELVDTIGSAAADKDELRKELKESLNQLIYVMLPQQSMRKMFINRQSIQGASSDMLRVFATSAIHGAYQQARFKHAQALINNLTVAREYIDSINSLNPSRAEVYRDYVLEVEKRVPMILSNEDTSLLARVAGKASDLTFFFMLSAPFTAMLNFLGFTQLTLPSIGGRFGYEETAKVVGKNFGRYFATVPKRSFNPLKQGRVLEMEFPSIVEGGNLSPLMQAAADQFIAEQQVNISMTNDIFDIGERPSATYTGRYNTVKRVLGTLFHQSERLNREVTLMSVFELAYQKYLKEPVKDARGVVERDAQNQPVMRQETDTLPSGQKYSKEAFDLAVEEAKNMAGLTLGDFTRQMKPRLFSPPALSVLLKFKQYAVTAIYATMRNLYLALGAPLSRKELDEFKAQMVKDGLSQPVIDQRIKEAEAERKTTYREARKSLAGILGVTFLYGGLEAMPFFSLMSGLASLLMGFAADDDDEDPEFYNFNNWFRNYLQRDLGGYTGAMFEQMGMEKGTAKRLGVGVGEAVGRGPVSTVTGGSLADRVSLDPKNLLYREGRYAPDTREDVIETVVANAGPVAGLALNWVDAYALAKEGRYDRAFEKLAPALFAKPATAIRYADEGARTRSGVLLADNFTAWELTMQSMGLQPERLAQAQKANMDINKAKVQLTARRDALLDRLYLEYKHAQKSGNRDVYARFIADAQEFSRRHPDFAVTNSIAESFKKRDKQAAEAEQFGANVPKRMRARADEMGYYGKN